MNSPSTASGCGSAARCWLLALLVLPFLVKNYRVFQFNLVLVYAIAVLGLNILTGFNGQISLGHGAFYAIGGLCRRHPDGPRRHALLGHAAHRRPSLLLRASAS
jgi:ABC-type branched-subunit amino acid transport system permease subunit